MGYYLLKVVASSVLIVAIAEISKRSTFWGAALASLPLVSLFAIVWIYIDTTDVGKIEALSISIFWLVIPSLALFVLLPLFLRQGLGFWLSLLFASVGTGACYSLILFFSKKIGIS